jgi:PAS domain S-box-containing protein
MGSNRNQTLKIILIVILTICQVNFSSAQNLRVGIYQNSPKVFIDKNGKPQGIFIDLMNKIAQNEGWTIEYVYGTWSENLSLLSQSKIDILLDVAYSDERAINYQLNSIFVIDDWLEAFTNKKNIINSVYDLHNKKVAVITGSIQEVFLQNEIKEKFNIEFDIISYPDYPTAAISIISGECHAMIASRFFYFSKDRHPDILPTAINLRPAQVYFAFPKGKNLEIVNAIDKNLIALKNNPNSTYYKSLKYWLGNSPNSYFPRYIKWVFFIGLIIILGTATFAFALKLQVKRRTKEIDEKHWELVSTNIQLNKLLTEHQKIEEELIQFRFMLENASQEVYLVYPNGNLAYVNQSVASNLGYSRDELIAGGVNLFDPAIGPVFFEHFEELKNRKMPPFETEHFAKDGSIRLKRIKSFYLVIGNQEFICGFADDITEAKKSEKALQESQHLFETLARMSPVGIFRTLENGYTTYVNPKWCELSGLSFEEALGDGWLLAVHPDDQELVLEDWRTRTSKGLQSEAEYRFLKPDGSIVWVLGDASPEIVNGQHLGYVGTITDITERKTAEILLLEKADEIEKQFEKYKQLIDLATDAFFHGDSKGNLIMVNNAAIELTGYSEKELLKMSILDLFSPDEIIKTPFRFDLLNLDQTIKTERQLLSKDGSKIYIEMNSKKMPDGTYQSFFRNINIRKETEILLKEQTEEIEAQNEEYRQLNLELQLAKTKAEESDKLKSAFLANMSHEIRTPMNAICGFSKLLENNNLDIKKRNEYVDIINSNSSYLLGIINDIVDISKIESGLVTVEKKPTNINAIIDNQISIFRNIAEQKNISLITKKGLPDSRAMVFSDEQKLSQILANLVSNSIKFTHKGYIEIGYINIKDEIEFFVYDSGIGIAPNHTEIIFDRFHQIDEASSESRRGTGLGLAISKAFVELMGGRIWVESEINKGSRFSFTVPYIPSELPQIIKPQPSKSKFSWLNKSVLIVEDDPHSLHFLNEILLDTQITIHKAQNGKLAVEMCRSIDNLDIVLMDIKLPIMNGIDATKEIRKFKPNLPIIAQTAYAFPKDAENAIKSGCNAFITKPINKLELLETINKLIA